MTISRPAISLRHRAKPPSTRYLVRRADAARREQEELEMALAMSLSMAEEEQGSEPPINTGSAPTEAPAVVVD